MRRFLSILVLSSSLVGCRVEVQKNDEDNSTKTENTSGSNRDTPTSLADTMATEVSEKGTTLELGEAKLEVPEGALNKEVEINIKVVEPPVPIPDEYKQASQVYKCTPHGFEFEKPVSLEIGYADNPEETFVVLRLSDDEDDSWEIEEASSFKSSIAKLSVEHFSFFVVVYKVQRALSKPDAGIRDADTGNQKCEGLITDTDSSGNPLIIAKDEQNYSFQASLTIQTTRVKSTSDLVFDWSELTKEMGGRDLDPLRGIDMLEVVLWENITEEKLREDMSTDNTDLGYLVGIVFKNTGNAITSANLFDLQAPASILPPETLLDFVNTDSYPPENHVYSVMLAKGETFGQGTLMIHFIRPDPNETNTVVKITNNSSVLDYMIDLVSLKKIGIPPGTANIMFDWTDNTVLTKNAIGNDFVPTRITTVMLAHYTDLTPRDLEGRFLEIDSIADEIWTAYLTAGTTISLSRLRNVNGEPFTGIDDQGTWGIALFCESCMSPAPWFFGILEACTN
jgi:hypothetical protein